MARKIMRTKLGAAGITSVALSLAVAGVAAASANLPDQADDRANEAVSQQDDETDLEEEVTELGTDDLDETLEDGFEAEVEGEGRPEDGAAARVHEVMETWGDAPRDCSFGQSIAHAARGEEYDPETSPCGRDEEEPQATTLEGDPESEDDAEDDGARGRDKAAEARGDDLDAETDDLEDDSDDLDEDQSTDGRGKGQAQRDAARP